MSQPSIGPKPYEKLGEELKQLRQHQKESLAEVCGAVEIDEHILERYEAGFDRPDEDVLNLLISHYQLQEPVASRLWELAGYDASRAIEDEQFVDDAIAAARQLIMVLASDGRTIYTDGVSIDCNKSGLQITFTQSATNAKPVIVSKLGMSYDQAQEVIKALGVALAYGRFGLDKPMLPPGKDL